VTDLASARSVQITRAVWLMVAIAATVAYAWPLISQWSELQIICHSASACAASSIRLNAAAARALSQRGISLGGIALFTTAVVAVAWFVWFGLGALIIWRKSQDRGALLSAFFLIAFPLLNTAGSAPEVLRFAERSVSASALVLFCLLFPDGRFVPRWTRWLAAGGVLLLFASAGDQTIFWQFLLALLVPSLGVQIYRFRSRSSWGERQQTKWAFSGLVVLILLILAQGVPYFVAPNLTGAGSLYVAGIDNSIVAMAVCILPVCLAIAVLRSRIWDIDRVISRALAYTALSLTLAGIYIGSVIGLQALFQTISGQQSGLAVAISTLVIAVLFNPLRHRIQDVIARTFSRRKYNAQQVLAAFGITCRDETDLEKLKENMVRVAQETVQPAHVSLWLRDSPRIG
jgi:hypothetical protein